MPYLCQAHLTQDTLTAELIKSCACVLGVTRRGVIAKTRVRSRSGARHGWVGSCTRLASWIKSVVLLEGVDTSVSVCCVLFVFLVYWYYYYLHHHHHHHNDYSFLFYDIDNSFFFSAFPFSHWRNKTCSVITSYIHTYICILPSSRWLDPHEAAEGSVTFTCCNTVVNNCQKIYLKHQNFHPFKTFFCLGSTAYISSENEAQLLLPHLHFITRSLPHMRDKPDGGNVWPELE